MLGISKPSLFGSDLPGIVLTKITTPLADGFIGYFDATTGQEFFNITKTQGESVIKPNGVANDLFRKPEAMIEIIVFISLDYTNRTQLGKLTAPMKVPLKYHTVSCGDKRC